MSCDADCVSLTLLSYHEGIATARHPETFFTALLLVIPHFLEGPTWAWHCQCQINAQITNTASVPSFSFSDGMNNHFLVTRMVGEGDLLNGDALPTVIQLTPLSSAEYRRIITPSYRIQALLRKCPVNYSSAKFPMDHTTNSLTIHEAITNCSIEGFHHPISGQP